MLFFSPALEESSELLLDQGELGLHFWKVTWDETFREILGRQGEWRLVSLGAELWPEPRGEM